MEIERANTHQQIVTRISNSDIFWWIWQIILTLAGCFFLLFGIQLLIVAYRLKDPFWFIMIFFASNLIILISATLLVGFVYRIIYLSTSLPKTPEGKTIRNQIKK